MQILKVLRDWRDADINTSLEENSIKYNIYTDFSLNLLQKYMHFIFQSIQHHSKCPDTQKTITQ